MTGKTSTEPTEIRLGRANGETFDLLSEVGKLSATELALVLEGELRFAGNIRFRYSVLDHSLFCWRGAKKLGASLPAQKACLLHDLTEACGIRDLPGPVKKALPGYHELELAILRQLEARWEYSLDQHAELVHDLDHWALAVEAKRLQTRTLGYAPRFMLEAFSAISHTPDEFLAAWREVGMSPQPRPARADHVHAVATGGPWLYQQALDVMCSTQQKS